MGSYPLLTKEQTDTRLWFDHREFLRKIRVYLALAAFVV